MSLCMPIRELQLLLPTDLIRLAIGDVDDFEDEHEMLPSESRLHKYVIKKPAEPAEPDEPAKLSESVLTSQFFSETKDIIEEFKQPELFESLYDSDFVCQIMSEIKIKQNTR